MFMSGGRTIPFVRSVLYSPALDAPRADKMHRVPGHDHAAIGYALDAGASIVIPQLETVEQAKHVVSAAKFGTRQNGTRSAPPFRMVPGLTDQGADGQRDVWQNLNDQAAIMVQIESLEGINNLDAILTEVPDIDVVWLGSLDCRISMNLPGNFGHGAESEWLAAVETFNSVMKKHDKPRAGFCLAPGEELTKMGHDNVLLVHAADVLKLYEMGPQLLAAREAVALKK